MKSVIWYPASGADLSPLVLEPFQGFEMLVLNDFDPFYLALFKRLTPGAVWYDGSRFVASPDTQYLSLWQRRNVGKVVVSNSEIRTTSEGEEVFLQFEVDGVGVREVLFTSQPADVAVTRLPERACRIETVIALRGTPSLQGNHLGPLNPAEHLSKFSASPIWSAVNGLWTDTDTAGIPHHFEPTGKKEILWGFGGHRCAKEYKRVGEEEVEHEDQE